MPDARKTPQNGASRKTKLTVEQPKLGPEKRGFRTVRRKTELQVPSHGLRHRFGERTAAAGMPL